jgi:hypothetical protein
MGVLLGSGNDKSARSLSVSKAKHSRLGSKSGPRECSLSRGGNGKFERSLSRRIMPRD